MIVTTQPGQFQSSDFQTGLTDCCDDCGVCWLTMCCTVCMGCSIASDMDECCMCGTGMAIRSVYRTRYNIEGSLCKDFLVTSCCFYCATCQLKRDINRRKAQKTF